MELLSFGDAGWGDEMLRGALMTLAVSLSSMALGLALGALGAAAKLSDLAPARWLAEGYTTVVRGVPELLVIYLLFFGGNGAAMFVAGLFGYHGYIELNAFTEAVSAAESFEDLEPEWQRLIVEAEAGPSRLDPLEFFLHLRGGAKTSNAH